MTPELAELKIKALLHDPPEKALMLMQGESHEARAEEYIKILLKNSSVFKPDEVAQADRIASGADRYTLYEQFPIRFLENPEVKHALSGVTYPLESMNKTILTEVKNNIEKAISEISQSYQDDKVKIYYALWRELQIRIQNQEQGNEKLGSLWSLLPADTRIPDHSIWEHRHIVSGLAGSLVEKKEASLLLFTLGPVQEFIAAARKTQDLWAGSYLLSFLSWQAMKVICNELGPDAIIFPDLYAQPLVDDWLKREINLNKIPNGDLSIPTLPNRFLAFVPSSQVESLSNKAANAVQSSFLEIGNYAIKKLFECIQDEQNIDKGYIQSCAEKQFQNFLECYWASVSLPNIKTRTFREAFQSHFEGTLQWDNETQNTILEAYEQSGYALNIGNAYGRLYTLLEQIVGSRKSLRNYLQVEESGYRCSLISRFAALLPKPDATPQEMRKFWQVVSEKSENKIRSNERLSAISLSKRYFPEYLKEKLPLSEIRFPSTSEVAAARFKFEVIDKAKNDKVLSQAVESYTRAVQELLPGVAFRGYSMPRINKLEYQWKTFSGIDGQYLFVESFEEEALKSEQDVNMEKRKASLEALKHLIKIAGERGIAPPEKYFAVLLLDGDEMGKWLSGEKSPPFRDALHSKLVEDINKSDNELWKKLVEKESAYRRPQAPSQHIAISRALNNYALKLVRVLVEKKYLGKLIYAGGDDVLALVPIQDALLLARDLRAAFSGQLSKAEWKVDWSNESGFVQVPDGELVSTLGVNATASVGIAVAHHTHPLQQVLSAARQAEKFAKSIVGRNAFGIQILKRSGEELQVGAKWRYETVDTTEVLMKFMQAINSGILSPRFVVDFQEESKYLPFEVIVLELRRLYERHTNKSEQYKEQVEELWTNIEAFVKSFLKDKGRQTDISELSQLFSGIIFIAKGGRR